MKARVLMYHDVTAPGRHTDSGFPSADAALYKLESAQFAAHLDALALALPVPPALPDALTAGNTPWLITFDDGGLSAHTEIIGLLEQRGWRGCFFMTTDFIDTKGFLDAAQLRDLHTRGHVVGSHSCSHPLRFSSLPRAAMLREWRDSVARLSDILGVPVVTASIPGGAYSRITAETAAAAGLRVLFTSEPTTKITTVDGCLIVGRYAVQRATPPAVAAALAAVKFLPAMRQALLWNAKKIAKKTAGPLYLKFRESWFKA